MDDTQTNSQTPPEPIVTPQEPKQEEYSYDEIHDNSTRNIIEDKPKPEEPKVEEKPEEVVTPAPEVKPEIPQQELDVDELAKKVANEAAQATVEAAKKAEEDALPKKTVAEEYIEKVQKEEGRTPNWDEALNFAAEKATEAAIKAVEDRETERLAKAEEERQQQEQNLAHQQEEFNKKTQAQIDELYERGELTRIKNDQDPNDPGVVELKALLQSYYDENTKRQAAGKYPINSIIEVYHDYYQKPNQQPAGADAPVNKGGQTGTAPTAQEPELDYLKDVHVARWNPFKRGAR